MFLKMGRKKKTGEEDSLKKLLHKAARPALLAMRVIGYMPNSISHQYEVTSRFCSIPFLWSVIVLAILLTGASQLYENQRLLFKNKFITSTMDKVCRLMVAWTFTLSSCGFGIKALLSMNATKKFWSLNYLKLEELAQISQQFDFRSAGFQKLKRKITRSTIKWTLIAGCFSFSMASLGAVVQSTMSSYAKVVNGSSNSSNDTVSEPKTSKSVSGRGFFLLIAMTASFLVAHLYMILSVYMCFFLQLYGSFLKAITTEMRECRVPFVAGSHPYLVKVNSSSRCMPDMFTKKVKDCIRAYYIIKDLVDAFSRHFTVELTIVLLVSLITIITSAFFGMYHGFNDVRHHNWINMLTTFIRIMAYAVVLYAVASVSTGLTRQADEFREELVRIDMDFVSTPMQAKVNRRPYGDFWQKLKALISDFLLP